MFCKNCGAEVTDNAQFCRNCGTAVSKPPQNIVKQEIPQKVSPRSNPAKSNNTKAIAIAVVATVLVMCVVMVVVGLFLNPPAAKPGNDTPQGNLVITPQDTVADTTASVETEPVNPLSESNPYRDMYNGKTFAVLAETDSRYYVRSELDEYSADKLCLARNEILARHGYIFSDKDLAEFFENMPWYSENQAATNDIYDYLNEYEQANVELLRFCQDRKEGKAGTVGNGSVYLVFYDPDNEYILPMSNRVKLESSHLQGLNKDMLCVARNEIFARRGYTFSDKDLLLYFSYCSWYRPSVPAGQTDQLNMSDIETENVEFIRSYEKDRPDLDSLDRTMNYTVSCDMFSVTLPAYWKTCADIQKESDYIGFYQKLSRESYGGRLFSFSVTPASEITDDSWEGPWWKIGTLVGPQGEQYYITGYAPTDVQFDYEDPYINSLYHIMYDEMNLIISTIEAADGYTFYPA